MVNVHAAVPLHGPFHPANTEPGSATAFSVTCEPWVKLELQVFPQLMPAGVLVTTPVPVPEDWTVN